MRYLVCLKEVPDTRFVDTDSDTGTLKRETAGSMLNPNDEYALSAIYALNQLKNGVTHALTLGPKHYKGCLRRALSLGVEKAHHLQGVEFTGSDVYATSYALKNAIKVIDNFDVIILGQQTSDGDTGQVPSELAALLGYNFCPYVTEIISINENTICVKNVVDSIERTMEIKLPVVLSIKSGSFKKRESTFKEKMLANKKEISLVKFDMFPDKNPEHYGHNGSKTKVINMYIPKKYKECIVKDKDFDLENDIKEMLSLSYVKIINKDKDFYDCNNDRVLIIVENYEIEALFEIISKIDDIYINYNLDVLSLNLTKENIKNIEKIRRVERLYSYHSDYDDYLTYIEALKSINLDCYIAVFAPSTNRGRVYLPYIAALNSSGITADCSDFEVDNNKLIQIRPAFSDMLYAKIIAKNSKCTFSTYRVGSFNSDLVPGSVETELYDRNINYPNQYVVKDEKVKPKAVEVYSDIVFVIGNAINNSDDIDLIKSFADKYKARLYCTRPVVMGGLLDSDVQIGISGKSIKAKLAVLIGVSGSNQTMEGLKRVDRIISINNNENAPIFAKSDIVYKENWKKIIGG